MRPTALPTTGTAAPDSPDFKKIAEVAHRNLVAPWIPEGGLPLPVVVVEAATASRELYGDDLPPDNPKTGIGYAHNCRPLTREAWAAFFQRPLAEALGLPRIDFDAFQIGFHPRVPYTKGGHSAGDFTFPERDAYGHVIGLALRSREWKCEKDRAAPLVRKWCYPGGKRGLFYPVDPNYTAKSAEEIEQERQRHFREVAKSMRRSVEHQAGNTNLMFAVNEANRNGVAQDAAARILIEEWNPGCQPPWSDHDIEKAIESAYGKNPDEHGTKFKSPVAATSAFWCRHDGPVLWVEGQSDTLAADFLDYDAVGRPNSGIDVSAALVALFKPVGKPSVSVADNEKSGEGRRTAKKLSQAAADAGLGSQMLLPPRKSNVAKVDLRSWVVVGKATHETVQQAIDAAPGIEAGPGEPDRETQPAKLIKAAMVVDEFFNDAGEPYALARIAAGHHETMPVLGADYGELLVCRAYKESAAAPGPQAIKTVQNSLAAHAKFEGDNVPVFVRVAHADGKVYLDLANPNRQIAVAAAGGWSIITDSECPVRFIRPKGMLALPVPVVGGTLEGLRPFVNLPDDQWPLLVAHLLSLLQPKGAFPILGVGGTQDSGKSTTARVEKRLIDPNKADLRNLPADERDFGVAAKNNFLLVFDNLSHITEGTSDMLCKASTGASHATRTLYSDHGETLLDIRRPITINGISPGLFSREDLRSRTLVVKCPPITQGHRRSESEFWADFDAQTPRMLGALFDCVSTAMQRLPAISPVWQPRMLDFYRWILAAEPATGLPEGAFTAALKRNQEDAIDAALENSPVAATLVHLVDKGRGEWVGTCDDILAEIHRPGAWDRRDLPKTPQAVAYAIERILPALEARGIRQLRGRKSTARSRIFRRATVPPTHRPNGGAQ